MICNNDSWNKVVLLPDLPNIRPPASRIRVTIVASYSGVQSTVVEPFVHRTPATAVLSFIATVLPSKSLVLGEVALIETWLWSQRWLITLSCFPVLTLVAQPPPSASLGSGICTFSRGYLVRSGFGNSSLSSPSLATRSSNSVVKTL